MLRKRVEAGEYAARQTAIAAIVTRQTGGYAEPLGATELALPRVYAELFSVATDSVSATASFFDLGGTSLDILRLKRLISTDLGVTMPVLSILKAPTSGSWPGCWTRGAAQRPADMTRSSRCRPAGTGRRCSVCTRV
jgi:hypothetical protein